MIGKNAGEDARAMLRHAGLSKDARERVAESTANTSYDIPQSTAD